MSQNNYYFGFGTFEEFLAASPTKQIYLAKSVNDSPGTMGVINRTWHITVAAIVDGVCHYWRMILGGDQIFGEPFPEQEKRADEIQALSSSLHQELAAIARDNGYSVIRGLVSIPKNVVVMTGITISLVYDKETNSFKRKVQPEQQAGVNEEKLAA